MKKTFIAVLVLAGLSGASARAGEVGLFLDKQVGQSQTLPGGKYDAVSPSGVGVRLGTSLLNLHVAELGAAITYHPGSERDLVLNGRKVGRFDNEYYAVGLQMDWKLLLNLHAGVDLRREKLTTDAAGAKDSTTVTRPWVKAGIGMSFPTPVVQPFVRLELAAPLTKEDGTSNADDFRKSMSPSLQVALYGGIRF